MYNLVLLLYLKSRSLVVQSSYVHIILSFDSQSLCDFIQSRIPSCQPNVSNQQRHLRFVSVFTWMQVCLNQSVVTSCVFSCRALKNNEGSFVRHNVKFALCVCLCWFGDRKHFLLSFVFFPFFFNLRMFSLLSCPSFLRVYVCECLWVCS